MKRDWDKWKITFFASLDISAGENTANFTGHIDADNLTQQENEMDKRNRLRI